MPRKRSAAVYYIVFAVLLFGAIIIGAIYRDRAPSELDSFAQCLTDEGAVFYGAYWCPNCKNQHEMFGSSDRLVNYQECAIRGGANNQQTQQCIDKNITGYPTWEFADGSRLSGTQPLDKLAEKTGCVLPGGEAEVSSDKVGESSPIQVQVGDVEAEPVGDNQ